MESNATGSAKSTPQTNHSVTPVTESKDTKTIPLDDEFFQSIEPPKEKDLSSLLKQYRVKPLDIVPPPEVCIKIKNNDGKLTDYGTLGNISTIIGKAKSRKSFTITMATSTALIGALMFDKLIGCLPENHNKILLFDTEQGKYHVLKSLHRICKLSGQQQPTNLEVYGLRPMNPSERLELIEYAINNTPNLGLVIIDCIKDLITSINDEEQATMIVSKLMKWSEEKNIHIINVLHQNKSNDHARGHIGTELINKSESVFSVTKDEQNPDISIFSADLCRGIEPDPFAFRINEQGLPEILNDYSIGKKKELVEEFNNEKLWMLINDVYKHGESFSYSELVIQFEVAYKKCYNGKIGVNKIKKLIVMCKIEKMVIQLEPKKPYFINKDYKLD